MQEQLLAFVSQYGAPALFLVVIVASIGAPLPIALLLIVTGSLSQQGAMNLWTAIMVAGTGSVLGDLAGYAIGRWGGGALINRLINVIGGAKRAHEVMGQIEDRMQRRGRLYIFLTRWLLSPLGPWVNLASGMARYPWGHFLLWDIVGEFFGAALYIILGQIFSDSVVALGSMLGDLTWGVLALTVALMIGRALFSYRRPPAA